MQNVFDQFDEQPQSNVFDQFDEAEDLGTPDEIMSAVGQQDKSRWNPVGAAKDVGKLIYDFPTQVKGAIGNAFENQDDIDAEVDWRDKWRKDADELNARRKKELAKTGGAEETLFPVSGSPTRGDIADTSASMGFSGVAMVPSVAGGLLSSTIIGAPAGIGLGMGGSFELARRMDKTMFTSQLLEKANADMVEAKGRKMTDEERKAYLEATDDIRSNHALWEAGPEAVGNAIGVFGLGKVFSGVAKKQLGTAVFGHFLNVAGEAATEIPTQMGQQRAESELGLTAEAPRQWGEFSDWEKSAREVVPQVLVQSGLLGAGSAVAGKARSLVTSKADPVEEIGKAETVDDAIKAANAAVDPESASEASPIQFSDEDKATHLQHAQNRLAELERKKNGTPDQEIQDEDGTVRTIRGEQPEYLTDAEKQELKWLWLNGNDQESIAKIYGFEPSKAEAEVTPEVTGEVAGEVQPDVLAPPDAVIAPEGPLRRKPQVTPQVTPLEKQPGESWAMYLKRRPDAIENAQEQNGQRELPAVEEQPAAVAEPVPQQSESDTGNGAAVGAPEAARTPEQSGNPGQLAPESRNVKSDTTGAAGQQGGAQPARASVKRGRSNVPQESTAGRNNEAILGELQKQARPEATAPTKPRRFSTDGVTRTVFSPYKEDATFSIVHKSGAVVNGYYKDQDFPGDTFSQKRGEVFLTEVPESERGKGLGYSLTKDAISLISANGGETVNLSPTSTGGKAIVSKLIKEGVISDALRKSATGKAEHAILGNPPPVAPNETPVEAQTDLPVTGETKEFDPLALLQNPSTAKQTEGKKDYTDLALDAVDQRIEQERANVKKWQGKTYKPNSKQVSVGGTADDLNSGTASVGAINNRRRQREITEGQKRISSLEKARVMLDKSMSERESIDILNSLSDDGILLPAPQVKETAETLTKPEVKEEQAVKEQTDKERQDAILKKYENIPDDHKVTTNHTRKANGEKVELRGQNAKEALAELDDDIERYLQLKGCLEL
jgi:hypothetical protein